MKWLRKQNKPNATEQQRRL